MKDENTAEQHICYCPWNNRAFRNTKDYSYEYCMTCNDIKSFHWKSFWRRLYCLFVDDSLVRKYLKIW